MPFTLRITFSGLCLFAPEAVDSGPTGRMHVLMPGMFGHHHDGADRHICALAYDAGSLVQDGSPLGVTALARLTDYTLAFGSGDTAVLQLCGHIPDLKEITSQPVHPDHLAGDTRGKLVSRVTLHAGHIRGVSPGVCWEWRPGEFRPIAHRVQWEIPEVEGDYLMVVAAPLSGGGASRNLGKLYPTNGLLNLQVLHDTAEHMPPDPLPTENQPEPKLGDPPHHFAAFFEVFGGPVPMLLPRYGGKLGDCPPPENACDILPPELGGSIYACLVAGVGL